MSQQSVGQAARRSVLNAQAVLRKQRADRERRLEGLAVTVLTALGERDGAVRDSERRAGQALQTMTEDEGLSVREAVEWCRSGVTVREVSRQRSRSHHGRAPSPTSLEASRPRTDSSGSTSRTARFASTARSRCDSCRSPVKSSRPMPDATPSACDLSAHPAPEHPHTP